MLAYFLFYFVAIFSYGIAANLRHRVKYLFLLISFLMVWLFAGLRGTVGQDTKNYTAHFDSLYTFSDMLNYFGKVEPFFAVLVVFTKLFFDSANILFVVVSFFQAALLFFVSNRLYHGFFFFSIYLLTFYADFHLNVLRAGLAGLFFVSALVTSNDRRASWLFFLLSVMSHISILTFFPIYALRLGLSFKLILKVILASGLVFSVYYFMYSDVLLYKFSVYFVDGLVFGEIPKTFLLLSLLGVGFWSISKNIRADLVAGFLVFAIFWVGATQVQIFHRLYSLGALIFFCLSFAEKGWYRFNVRPLIIYSLILGLWFSFFNYIGMVNESEKWKRLGGGDLEYTYIPYSLANM